MTAKSASIIAAVLFTIQAIAGTDQITIQTIYNNGRDTDTFNLQQQAGSATTPPITVNGTATFSGTFLITNGAVTTIQFTGVSTAGVTTVYDVSPSNMTGNVQYSIDGTNNLAITKAGDPALFRSYTNLIRCTLTTGASNHWIQIKVKPD